MNDTSMEKSCVSAPKSASSYVTSFDDDGRSSEPAESKNCGAAPGIACSDDCELSGSAPPSSMPGMVRELRLTQRRREWFYRP